MITQQIAWGRRVRGIVKESDLIEWYERCLRGKFKDKLASPLLQRLAEGFKAEFPQNDGLAEFISERGYDRIIPPDLWKI
jgi:type II restriction enzyme